MHQFFKPQAILFDLDGTLIDSAADLAAAVDKLRTARGLPSIAFERYRLMAGAGARGLLHVAFGMSPEHADFASYREEFYQNYERGLSVHTVTFEGVTALLGQLVRAQIPWGIVTNKSQRFTQPLVAQMPVLQGAAAVISGDSTPYTKPHPEPLWAAARTLNIDPRQCWYVGDDKRDIQAGQAAGMATLAASWGYLGVHAIEQWGADAILNHPSQLLDILSSSR